MADQAVPGGKESARPVASGPVAADTKASAAKLATSFNTLKALSAKTAAGGTAAAKPAATAPTTGVSAAKPTVRINAALGEPPAAKQAAAPTKPPPAKKAAAKPPPPSEEQLEFDDNRDSAAVMLKRAVPAWLVSGAVHMVILIVLGLIALPPEVKQQVRNLVASVTDTPKEVEEVVEQPIPIDVNVQETEFTSEVNAEALNAVVESVTTPEPAAAQVSVDITDISPRTMPKSDLLSKIGAYDGAGQSISGSRSEGGRKAAVFARGGNSASESAVAKALEWLAKHQAPDGGWSFDHNQQKCNGQCQDCGTALNARTAATALGVLPFLGAGQTHKAGKYKKEVGAALAWLVNNEKVTKDGGDLRGNGGGNTGMYAHGLASIALCEAYAMTNDRNLVVPAQAAIGYIVNAQDPLGGGWRYSPRSPGDTSVVGWQLMALKSGHMGYLQVPKPCLDKAKLFLDTVQGENGATYGYTEPGKGSLACTAVGLLCRMYMGWKHEEPALLKGCEKLAKAGPAKDNMYFNYYATQVLHHYGGELWEKWNEKMRDQLVNTQAQEGHAAGSWQFDGGHSEPGGRLYNTALACMTLEVYYRHLPLYKKASRDDDF